MIRTKEEPEKRHRNVAHLWADKRIVRFFRKNFSQKDYKNFRSVYLAVCEIESDFGEHSEIYSFTKTVATYAGMGEDTARPYLKALRKADIIDYWQENIGGRFGNTILDLFKWSEQEENQKLQTIEKTLKYRSRKNPVTVEPGSGVSRSIKNTSKEVGLYKNSKESINKKKIQKNSLLENLPKEWLDNTSFQKILDDFIQHRKEKRQSITPQAGIMLANKLSKFPMQVVMEALENSIANGWTGVFPENGKSKPKSRVTIGSGLNPERQAQYEEFEKEAKRLDDLRYEEGIG